MFWYMQEIHIAGISITGTLGYLCPLELQMEARCEKLLTPQGTVERNLYLDNWIKASLKVQKSPKSPLFYLQVLSRLSEFCGVSHGSQQWHFGIQILSSVNTQGLIVLNLFKNKNKFWPSRREYFLKLPHAVIALSLKWIPIFHQLKNSLDFFRCKLRCPVLPKMSYSNLRKAVRSGMHTTGGPAHYWRPMHYCGGNCIRRNNTACIDNSHIRGDWVSNVSKTVYCVDNPLQLTYECRYQSREAFI